MTDTGEILVNSSMDRAESILGIFEDTFGEDDRKVKQVYRRYTEIVQIGTPEAYKLATTYLEWALNHVERIGRPPLDKTCRCEYGHILDDVETDTWRPCPKCLPGAYDKWMGVPGSDDDGFDDFDGKMDY